MAPHQAEGLAFPDLERLLVQASSAQRNAWVEYWWGTVLDNLEDCQKHLRIALTAAIDDKDYDLISKICLELGRAYSRTGRLKRALSVSKLADDVAAKSAAAAAIMNALRLKATLNFHWGDPRRGNALFLKAIQNAPTTMDQHQLRASLALFQAGYGFDIEARANLTKVSSYAESLGHAKVHALVQLTQYILLARSSEPKSSYNLIVKEMFGSEHVSAQILSYGHELLSGLCERNGDKKLAASHRAKAEAARHTTGDVPTLWVEVLRGNSVVGHALA
jgi:tetratricopeptide (TPR) repeat protein